MARSQGLFLVLEGPDKSGKSTQADRLARALRGRGLEVVHTREPGGTMLAEAVRRILLDPKERIGPLAELLLYEAARAQHTQETILPALAAGSVVLSERYTMSSLAYQGVGRGLGLATVRTLNRIASLGLVPGLTIVLDIPESEFGRRRPGQGLDRIEAAGGPFRRRIRQAYRRLARTEPGTVILNGRLPHDELHSAVLAAVEPLLKKRP